MDGGKESLGRSSTSGETSTSPATSTTSVGECRTGHRLSHASKCRSVGGRSSPSLSGSVPPVRPRPDTEGPDSGVRTSSSVYPRGYGSPDCVCLRRGPPSVSGGVVQGPGRRGGPWSGSQGWSRVRVVGGPVTGTGPGAGRSGYESQGTIGFLGATYPDPCGSSVRTGPLGPLLEPLLRTNS